MFRIKIVKHLLVCNENRLSNDSVINVAKLHNLSVVTRKHFMILNPKLRKRIILANNQPVITKLFKFKNKCK